MRHEREDAQQQNQAVRPAHRGVGRGGVGTDEQPQGTVLQGGQQQQPVHGQQFAGERNASQRIAGGGGRQTEQKDDARQPEHGRQLAPENAPGPQRCVEQQGQRAGVLFTDDIRCGKHRQQQQDGRQQRVREQAEHLLGAAARKGHARFGRPAQGNQQGECRRDAALQQHGAFLPQDADHFPLKDGIEHGYRQVRSWNGLVVGSDSAGLPTRPAEINARSRLSLPRRRRQAHRFPPSRAAQTT
jgi:hypothetical protein